jgi:heme exporter protein D
LTRSRDDVNTLQNRLDPAHRSLGDLRSFLPDFQERDVNEFMAMGGYGAYVWAAYGITLLALLLLFIWSWFGARAREAELEQVRKLSRTERRAPSSATLREPEPARPQPSPTVRDASSGAS